MYEVEYSFHSFKETDKHIVTNKAIQSLLDSPKPHKYAAVCFSFPSVPEKHVVG